ncbi:MAG: RluA family pseudouridine synthase [Nannocystaceae bacterium]
MKVTLEGAALRRRLDVVLVEALAERGLTCTRSQLRRAFDAGLVRGPGGALKPSTRLEGEAPVELEVCLAPPPPLKAEPEALPLTVVYEDADLLVVDKAAGMVVHAGPGHPRGTLVNAVLFHLGAQAEDLPVLPGNDATRPGIVHRLDRDTSGLLVVAKHVRAQEGLAVQFREHTIRREYLGIVDGAPSFTSRAIETLHGRDPRDRRRFSPEVARGRTAITRAQVEARFGDEAALLRFTLSTGRTHQIRMHARHLGHPIVGDALYGRRPAGPRLRALVEGLGRHALHAAVLGVDHPIRGVRIELESPLPPELQALVDGLR